MSISSLERGAKLIKGYVKTLSLVPGVYRMLNERGQVLYVGKAKELKKRVNSYTFVHKLPIRLQRMVAETTRMEFVQTNTESEALLLEANLIKKYEPRYNILLKDDKSYAFIQLTNHPFPLLRKHRGSREKDGHYHGMDESDGQYFGPFASNVAINETINLLHKAFLLRSCPDTIFNARTRPCLQYQIKRCSAPCVGRISEKDYGESVQQAARFLKGGSQELKTELVERMQRESEARQYEAAAKTRGRVQALTYVQSRHSFATQVAQDVDVFAVAQVGQNFCVQLLVFRHGANYGTQAIFPIHTDDASLGEVLQACMMQFYTHAQPAPMVLVNEMVADLETLTKALTQARGQSVHIQRPKRGEKKELVFVAEKNALAALERKLAASATERKNLQSLQELLDLTEIPGRIEVYDNSHIQGAHAVGTMIVAGPEGFQKNAYRKFNIRSQDISAGDDYAMMREVLTRRFKRALEQREVDPDQWPSVVILDGGRGQLSAAENVFADLGIADIALMAVAKGPERNAGRETFFFTDGRELNLKPNDGLLHYIQRLRDEAHRFAIGTHRAKRQKNTLRSSLDDLPGIGPKRKKALIHFFGSAKGVKAASFKDLQKVEGISKALAQKIYDILHGSR